MRYTSLTATQESLTKLTHLLVHCALEVHLVDGDTGIAVLGTCTVCQSAHSAGGKAHQGVGHSGLGAFSYWVARQYGVSTSCNQRGWKPTGWKMQAFTLRSICMDSGLVAWKIDLHISGESRKNYWQQKNYRVEKERRRRKANKYHQRACVRVCKSLVIINVIQKTVKQVNGPFHSQLIVPPDTFSR